MTKTSNSNVTKQYYMTQQFMHLSYLQ